MTSNKKFCWYVQLHTKLLKISTLSLHRIYSKMQFFHSQSHFPMDHKIKLSAGSFMSAAQAQIHCILEFMYGSVSVKIHFFWVVLLSRLIFLCFLIFNIPTGLLNLEQLLRRFLISKETLSVRMLDDSQDPTPLLKEIRNDKTATIVVDANTTMSHIILERVSVLHLAAVSFMLFYLPLKNLPHFHNAHTF